MRLILVCAVALVLVVDNARCGMTEAQFKSAVQLLRKVCQPKTKVTNAQIEGLHEGNYPAEPSLMCYAECILKTGQIMKDGKLNIEAMRTQMGNLPPNVGGPGIVSLDNCKDSPKSTEKCGAAYDFYKCFYEDNPSNFFLP